MENRRLSYALVVLLALVVAFARSNASPSSEQPSPAPNPNPTTPTAPASPTVVAPSPDVKVSPTPKEVVASDATKTQANKTGSDKGIQIDVYYEAMCSDCVKFFNDQLLPVHEALKKFINVEYIPFSLGDFKVKDNTPNIICSRDGECNADKVHACGIDKIKDSDKLVKFLNCALDEGYKSSNKIVPIEKCGANSSVTSEIIASISECSNGSDWIQLLEKCYNSSRAVSVKTVPTIIINKVNSDNQQSLLKNFKKAVCDLIPSADKPDYCKNNVNGSGTLVVGILPTLLSVYYAIRMF